MTHRLKCNESNQLLTISNSEPMFRFIEAFSERLHKRYCNVQFVRMLNPFNFINVFSCNKVTSKDNISSCTSKEANTSKNGSISICRRIMTSQGHCSTNQFREDGSGTKEQPQNTKCNIKFWKADQKCQ